MKIRLTLCFAALSLVACAEDPTPLTAPNVPPELQVSDSEQVAFMAHGKGDQIYVCVNNANGEQFGWTLRAPEAKLTDNAGKEVGQHYIGPTWKWADGSHTKGKVITSSRSPDPTAISWLLLASFDHSDEGTLSHITSIQRINTKGGRAPNTGCDGSHLNTEVRVPYSADYYFYVRATPRKRE